MPDQRYTARPFAIGELLSTNRTPLAVPEWQRSYSWTTEEVEAFWQDLVLFDGQYPGTTIAGHEYFLGSIVLVTEDPPHLLLDGQQRLATATILLAVLRDARREYKADAATRLQHKYIADLDDATEATTHVLTLNHYDRDFFRSEVQDEPRDPPVRPTPQLKSHGLIRKAREYLAERVAEECSKAGEGREAYERNLRIGDVVLKHMSVVAVTSSDEENAAAVFETLNDRGIGLATPDLLRNLLLRRATDSDARTRIVNAWEAILSVSEDGVSVDEFLRHYWVSQRGDVKARKLYREIREKILGEDINSLDFSLDLAEAAVLYANIVVGREDDPDLRRLLQGINVLGAKALYPVLLSGYVVAAGHEDHLNQLKDLARTLTALFIRYNVVGGRETTVMESTLYSAAAKLREDKDFAATTSSVAALAPSEDDFVRDFRRASVRRIATARYILREIEHAKRRTQEVAVEDTDRVQVEHIYPKTPEGQKWDTHDQFINRLGNLTLLAKRLNASIRNSDFETKKKKGYKDSDLLLTKELDQFEEWTTETIEERQSEMSKWIGGIWAIPGGDTTQSSEGSPSVACPAEAEGSAVPVDQLPEAPG